MGFPIALLACALTSLSLFLSLYTVEEGDRHHGRRGEAEDHREDHQTEHHETVHDHSVSEERGIHTIKHMSMVHGSLLGHFRGRTKYARLSGRAG